MRRAWTFAVVLVGLMGCGGPKSAPVAAKTYPAAPADPWKLTTLDPTGGAPAYLANGLIGVRIGRNGGGLDETGKPLGFFMIDEYQPTGEEKILPLPSPVMVAFAIGNKVAADEKNHDFLKSGGTPLDPRSGTDYSQSLDMKTGLLTTSWKQTIDTSGSVTIKCETVIHPTERSLGQRWTLTSPNAVKFSIRTLDYAGPNDPQVDVGGDAEHGIFVTASKNRVVVTTLKTEGFATGDLSAEGGFRIQEGTTLKGMPLTFERTVNFGAHSAKSLPAVEAGNDLSAIQKAAPKPFTYDEIASASTKNWAKRWKTDIEIDGPVEDQQAVRSFLYYLRSSIAPNGRRSISPFTLSDATYNGHTFWDADIWVQPALLMTDPDLAKSISDYRLDRVKTPVLATWLNQGRPTSSSKLGDIKFARFPNATMFPWESSGTGNETAIGPSRFEHHITGSVAWGIHQAAQFGLVDPKAAADTVAKAAEFYRLRATGDQILGVMSPDENHVGNNDLYTNLLASWAEAGGKWPATPKYKLPKDNTSFLTYDDDQGKGYKQAAAVLSIYPLQFPPAEKQAKAMMSRFAEKVIKNGPAMSDSVHATIWARQGEVELAYKAWQASWQPFTRNPLLLFSEKRSRPTTYFTTGAGGSLQTVLYGFLGMRVDWKQETGAEWSTPLLDEVLSVRPHLPQSWKSVKLKNFTVRGRQRTLIVTQTPIKGAHVQVIQGE